MCLSLFKRSLITKLVTASPSCLVGSMQAAAAAAQQGPAGSYPLRPCRLLLPGTRLGRHQRPFSARSKPLVPAAAAAAAGAAGAQGSAGSSVQPGQQQQQQQGCLDLDTVLTRVRQAVHGSHPLWQSAGNRNAQVFGEGWHMGLPVAWAFLWRPDGAWYEEVRSQHLTYKWGYDGAGQCWEVDPYGVSKLLERDDHESSVLGALIRSGNWLVPEVAAQHLEIQLEEPAASSNEQQTMPLAMPPVAVTWDIEPCPYVAAAASTSNTTAAAAAGSTHSHPHHHHEQQQQGGSSIANSRSRSSGSCSSSGGGGSAVVAAAAPAVKEAASPLPDSAAVAAGAADGRSRRRAKDSGAVVYVTVKLKAGKMLARLQVSTTTWRPVAYRQPFCSETEAWVFEEWNNWTQAQQQQQQQQQQHAGGWRSDRAADVADVLYPRRVTHMLCQGVSNSYITHGGITRGGEVHTAYQLPASPPVPCDVQYLETVSPCVPAWQTFQGHLLIQAHLNGRQAGWMLLDTGASGFVIEPAVADRYRLPAFGDLSIAGIAGKVPTRFRRASQLRLGPLVLSDPVLLEMSLAKIVGGFHEDVIGIVGYDVFRRCRVTIPCHNTRRAIQKAVSWAGQVKPYNPAKDTAAAAKAAAHPWPPTAALAQQMTAALQAQREVAAASAAAGSIGVGQAVGAAAAAAAGAAVRHRRRSSSTVSSSSSAGPKRRRARFSAARVAAGAAAAAAASCAPAAAAGGGGTAAVADRPSLAEQQQQQQQAAGASLHGQPPSVLQQVFPSPSPSSSSSSQQQSLLQLPPVPVPPPKYPSSDDPLPTALIEVLLHKPVIRAPHEFEDGYIWQDIVMIASLPHVELEFVVPGKPDKRHKSLFLVDTGAGGAEVMFHSRASRELELLDHNDPQYKGWGEGLSEYRTVSGVGGGDPPPPSSNSSSGSRRRSGSGSNDSSSQRAGPSGSHSSGVGCQAGKLPELVIRGQAGSDPSTQGSLQLKGVRALFNRAGGLDISLYSAGMVCADLLSRMQVVFDYPNKRIGWKVPPPGALAQLQQQEEQQQQQGRKL